MSYKYQILWLKCFHLIKRREGLTAALDIMYTKRKERSEKELTELLEVLQSIPDIDGDF